MPNDVMPRELSRYLDMLRVIAALLVLFAHVINPGVADGYNQIGYSAVMVFFVLSGYVIAFVAGGREATLLDFALSRTARITSVALPALALTIAVDLLLLRIAPMHHAEDLLAAIPRDQYAHFPAYLAMHVLFLDQLWDWEEFAFSNATYWSLCYEVYYYVLFAVAFYLAGWRRFLIILSGLVIVGPFVVLRFHLWLLGYAAYRLHHRIRLRATTARLILAATLLGLALDLATDLNLRIDERLDLVTGGWVGHGVFRRFAGDTLTGLMVALNLFAARDADLSLGRAGAAFAYLASFSFTLYLMHSPLLRLWSAYLPVGRGAAVLLVLGSVWLLGQATEHQKHRLRALLRRHVADRIWPGRGLPARAML